MTGSGIGILEFLAQPAYPILFLDGRPLSGYAQLDETPIPADPSILPTQAGSHIVQRLFRGITAPASLRARSWSLKVQIAVEEDYFTLSRCENRGAPISFFSGLPMEDVWDATAGQQQFSTSRFLPYGGTLRGAPPITSAASSCPVRAWLNDIEQQVITTGALGANQVLISTAPLAQNRSVQVGNSVQPADVLRVRYYPLHFVIFEPQRQMPSANQLDYSATLKEAMLGHWD